jgi:hypothetical protein
LFSEDIPYVSPHSINCIIWKSKKLAASEVQACDIFLLFSASDFTNFRYLSTGKAITGLTFSFRMAQTLLVQYP